MELPPMGVDPELPILKNSKVSTGIRDLDIILEGGYQNPGNIMVIGPTGMEKLAFAFHFAAAANPKKEVVYIITGDATPDSVKKKASSVGISLNKENINFIDCYSATLGRKELPPDEGGVSYVSGPGALNDISLAINEAIRSSAGKRIRVIYYSLSTFVLYNPKDSILKFLQVVGGRLKNAGATTMYLVEEGVHDKQLISLVEHSMDEKYNLVDRGGKFDVDIAGVGVPVPFKMGPSGITIL